MSNPTAAQLATARAAQQATMTTACTVSAPGTLTPDGTGGHSAGTPTSTATVCRVAPTAGDEIEIAAQLQAVGAVTIALPYGTAITEDDTITVGADTYQIKAVLEHGSLATATRVLATKAG